MTLKGAKPNKAIPPPGATESAITAGCCCVIAGIVTVIYGPQPLSWIGLAIYLGIAVGTWMMSPNAAMFGLVLACVNLAVCVLPFIVDPLNNSYPDAMFALLFVFWIKTQFSAAKDAFAHNASKTQT